jgi:hypothetical protein
VIALYKGFRGRHLFRARYRPNAVAMSAGSPSSSVAFLTPIKIETLAKSHRSPGRYRVFADDKLASDPKIHG